MNEEQLKAEAIRAQNSKELGSIALRLLAFAERTGKGRVISPDPLLLFLGQLPENEEWGVDVPPDFTNSSCFNSELTAQTVVLAMLYPLWGKRKTPYDEMTPYNASRVRWLEALKAVR